MTFVHHQNPTGNLDLDQNCCGQMVRKYKSQKPFNIFTARKRSLRRLCFYTCLSFCPKVGGYRSMHCRWYPSMPWRFPGPHPGGGKLRGLAKGDSPGPHPKGKLRGLAWGVVSRPTPRGEPALGGVCSQGGCSRGVSAPRRECLLPGGSAPRRGLRPGRGWRPPPRDGYCCGQYASYRNAFFFFLFIFSFITRGVNKQYNCSKNARHHVWNP